MKYFSYKDYMKLQALCATSQQDETQEIALEQKINASLAEYENQFRQNMEQDESGLCAFFFEHSMQDTSLQTILPDPDQKTIPIYIQTTIDRMPADRKLLYLKFTATDIFGTSANFAEFLYADITNFTITTSAANSSHKPVDFLPDLVLADEFELLAPDSFQHSYCLKNGYEFSITFPYVYCWLEDEPYLSADVIE